MPAYLGPGWGDELFLAGRWGVFLESREVHLVTLCPWDRHTTAGMCWVKSAQGDVLQADLEEHVSSSRCSSLAVFSRVCTPLS